MAAPAAPTAKSDTIDGFQRYDIYPSRTWSARGLSAPKLGRPTEVRAGGQHFVRSLAFSADGTHIAVGHESKTLRLYPASGGVISDRGTTLPSSGDSPHRGNVANLAWSPTDPHILVSGCKGVRGDSVVAVWDVRTPAAAIAQFGVPGDVLHVAFHPNGRHFAAVCPRTERDVVFFYHLKDGAWVKREDVQINGAGVGGGEEQVNSFRFGNGGRAVLAVNQDGSLNTWWYPVDEVVREQTVERPAKRSRVEEKEEEEEEEEKEAVEREPTPEPEPEAAPDREAPEAVEGEGEGEGGAGAGEGADSENGDGEVAEGDGAGDSTKPEGESDKADEGEDKPADEEQAADEPADEQAADGLAAEQAADGLAADAADEPATDAPDDDAVMAEASPTQPALPTPARTPAPGTPVPGTPAPASARPSRAPSPTKTTQGEKDAADAAAKAAARAEREAHVRLIQLERGPRKVVSVGLSLALAVDPRGRYYAIGGHDARLSLLSTTTLTATRTWDECAAPIRHAAFSGDGEYLAVGGDEAAILIFGVVSGEVVGRIPVNGATSALSWHPGQNVLAYATNAKNRGVGWWYATVE